MKNYVSNPVFHFENPKYLGDFCKLLDKVSISYQTFEDLADPGDHSIEVYHQFNIEVFKDIYSSIRQINELGDLYDEAHSKCERCKCLLEEGILDRLNPSIVSIRYVTLFDAETAKNDAHDKYYKLIEMKAKELFALNVLMIGVIK